MAYVMDSLYSGYLRGKALKYQAKLNEMKAELEKNETINRSTKLITKQHKEFGKFIEIQEKKNSSQTNYLNYMNVDKRSSISTEIKREQQSEYYKGETQHSDNVKEIEGGLTMNILSQDFNSSISKYNTSQSIQANNISTVSNSVNDVMSIVSMMS